MRKYNIINNTLGWLVFLIAAVTYLLTIEPTASFWDCPEFIAQGFKSEIGHPPGNPIFILAARFAAHFAGGQVTAVAACVNAMSAMFSAATILLLFWTITHLVKKLLVEDGNEALMTTAQYLVIMGSGLVGALAYTWSDTFWYSAVEAEVYAFSSFCTALVFWLILKWENRADEPGSDRWLILIAYIIGVSLGVHLLNLLCIPAIALVYYYRRYKNTSAKGSLITLLISFAIIVLVLYGLEPGFVKFGQKFDLFAVNTLGMSFNMGALMYAILLVAVLAWNIWELYRGTSELRMKLSFALAIALSGMLLVGGKWWITTILLIALLVYLFRFCKAVPVRLFSNVSISILVIFLGFASYALILIRSNANTPLDENSPNNTFALAKYLSREQYGETPLLYGRTVFSDIQRTPSNGYQVPLVVEGDAIYSQEIKKNPSDPDRYIVTGHKQEYKYIPQQNMLFPRIHSDSHAQQYIDWLGMDLKDPSRHVEGDVLVAADGSVMERKTVSRPTMGDNLRFFIDYQLNYMYWRYFMWNFAGRQNDIQGMGEITQGNWLSGIPFIDNLRLGDQSLLPDDYGTGNKGHNVFYLLPLLLGIVGLLWQAYRGKRGIEQFWVIFFLFFMTGIAIVLYLNQTPSQPRERDYAYAGSFYAFAIWIGMGVAGLWRLMLAIAKRKKADKKGAKKAADNEKTRIAPDPERTRIATADSEATQLAPVTSKEPTATLAMAVVAVVLGIIVPLQMVSQTWDDHDRSGRYAARDFGMNYLSSLDKNAVIFTNGDNDTFPLWYAQEVEGYRTDVRVVNLSYLATDWYIAQMQRAAYDSKPLPMQADALTYAYDRRQAGYFFNTDTAMHVPVIDMLKQFYSDDAKKDPYGSGKESDMLYCIAYPNVFMPVDAEQAVKAGIISAEERDQAAETINLNLRSLGGGMNASQLACLDIIASSIAQGWQRPCYFAMTVPDSYYLGLSPYLRSTGMAYQVTPIRNAESDEIFTATDKMYDNVMNKFRWGGIDVAKPADIYLDETIRRMVTTTRTTLTNLAVDLIYEGNVAKKAVDTGQATFMGKDANAYATDRYAKAARVLDLMQTKLPAATSPYAIGMGQRIAMAYKSLYDATGDKGALEKATKLIEQEVMRYGQYARFYQSLTTDNYSRLTRQDQYIDALYLPGLVQTYSTLNPSGADKLLNNLRAMGVNLDRMSAMIQAQQQPRMVKATEPVPLSDTSAAF